MCNSIRIVLFCGTLLYSNVCETAVISRHRSSLWNHHFTLYTLIHCLFIQLYLLFHHLPYHISFWILNNTAKIQTTLQIDHTSNKALYLFVAVQKILPFTHYSIHHVIATHKQEITLVNGSNRLPNHFISIPLPNIYIFNPHTTQISIHSLPFPHVGHFCIIQPIIGFPEIGP